MPETHPASRQIVDELASRPGVEIETAIPGLYASEPEQLPFAPHLDIRAFVLRRELGNLLVYSVEELGSDARAIEALGPISRRYLNLATRRCSPPSGLPVHSS
jgi:hypothetical protein